LESIESRLLGQSPWDQRLIFRVGLFSALLCYIAQKDNLLAPGTLMNPEVAQIMCTIFVVAWCVRATSHSQFINPFWPIEEIWTRVFFPKKKAE
jgi:hypothetical protein